MRYLSVLHTLTHFHMIAREEMDLAPFNEHILKSRCTGGRDFRDDLVNGTT